MKFALYSIYDTPSTSTTSIFENEACLRILILACCVAVIVVICLLVKFFSRLKSIDESLQGIKLTSHEIRVLLQKLPRRDDIRDDTTESIAEPDKEE